MKKGENRQSLLSAFRNAFNGITRVLSRERNMKIHVCFALIALFMSFCLSLEALEFVLVLTCIALVMSLELVNSAIEALVDLVSPEYHELAKHAKDAAAGAVLFAAVFSIVVALILFVPKILAIVI